MVLKKILLFAVMLCTAFIRPVLCSAQIKLGNVTVLGDSIASGYGLPDYTEGNNYSSSLSWGNLLGEESWYYENYAADGLTTDELLNKLREPPAALQKALERADCIVISIGGNDFLGEIKNAALTSVFTDKELFSALLRGEITTETLVGYTDRILKSVCAVIDNADVEKTVSNIKEIVNVISEINSDTEIVLFTIYNPFSEHILLSGISDSAEAVLAELNGKIKAISAEEEHMKIADIHDAFSSDVLEYTNINSFDIHPSVEGHKKIYEVLLKTILQ